MAGKLAKWPSNRGLISKIRHRLAAKGIQFSRRWYGGMISANLEVIWEMSVQRVRLSGGRSPGHNLKLRFK